MTTLAQPGNFALVPENSTIAEATHPTADAGLLAAAARGDQRAFANLVDRYYPSVFRVVWRMTNGHGDAEDITQEAFLRLWSNPGQLREAGALKGWLMRVANNLVMDRFRRRSTQDLDSVPEIEDGRADAADGIDRNWAAERVDAAVARLPERQKFALTLVHFEQMSNIAAAAAMEISVEALESLLARARRGLKETLAGDRTALLAAFDEKGH